MKIGTMAQSTEQILERFRMNDRMNCRDILDLIEALEWQRRQLATALAALRPFSEAWNPDRPARSWGGVTPDDYERASATMRSLYDPARKELDRG